MNILFTGASSFTGCWFVKELAGQGHRVTTVFQGSKESYTGLKLDRINMIKDCSEQVFDCSFGSDTFLDVIESDSHWDLLCHHAADVTDYKSPSFNISKAVSNNCHHIFEVIEKLKLKGCRKLAITGSVFEQNEGAGCASLAAFSPYGFSKGITSDIIHYLSHELGVNVGKFVIPNPFGAYEEPRFTNYLCKTWSQNQIPKVMTPDYVRDNIHVSLLAAVYAKFVLDLVAANCDMHISPSGYVETQGAFTRRFAREMRNRLRRDFPVDFAFQATFDEPRIRFNTSEAASVVAKWDESASWDQIANYYDRIYQFS